MQNGPVISMVLKAGEWVSYTDTNIPWRAPSVMDIIWYYFGMASKARSIFLKSRLQFHYLGIIFGYPTEFTLVLIAE